MDKQKLHSSKTKMNNIFNSKNFSRMIVIQASYAFFIHDDNSNFSVIANQIFSAYKNKDILHITDDIADVTPDEELFNKLVLAFPKDVENQEKIITKYLKSNWNIHKLDILLKCILVIGTIEMQFLGDIPAKLIIDSYVTVTKHLCFDKEINFVNAILENIAREIRPHEF